ncbi:YhjD/YihY/BrkB family envelope integrity protein [Natrinema halophilum]|uniref:YihY/virulence factor BrkB family protein n=1 Tax=Natrinema halophilum TaxID=1699371 RepID=A0A7D5GIG8_9EURY|nr:YhjD/YihY/BrkB family envelope integrity protein [Natrinema halophilum]QLG49707.1 YihY/virulence factor BrkB family protein [Natrinema halophilum]
MGLPFAEVCVPASRRLSSVPSETRFATPWVLGSIGLAIIAIVGTSALFSLPLVGRFAGFVGFAVLFLASTVVFLPLYYVPLRSVTTPSAALPKALVTAFGWPLVHTGPLLHYYTANASRYAIYGVLSGFSIILTSLYLAAVLLMVGIAVNATLEDERRVTNLRAD